MADSPFYLRQSTAMVYITFLTASGESIAIDPGRQKSTFRSFQDGLIAESRMGERDVSYEKYRLKRGRPQRPSSAAITIVRSVQRELDRLRDKAVSEFDEDLLSLAKTLKPNRNKPKCLRWFLGDLRLAKVGDFSVVYAKDAVGGNLRVLLVRIGRWVPHQRLVRYFGSPEKTRTEICPARESTQPAKRKWTDSFVGYSGETAKELFSYPADGQHASLVAGFREGIQRKAAKKGEHSLTAEERVVLVVSAFEEEVNNGGFDQFFRNSSRRFAAQVGSSLRLIRCSRIARIADRAVKTLRLPNLKATTIRASMNVDSAERDEKLEKCDRLFYTAQMRHNVARRLYEFIRRNRTAMKF